MAQLGCANVYLMSKRITLLTGPPGAGKGTQAGLIADSLDWHAFSVGAILRDTASPDIKVIMNSGKLLPAEEVVELVIKEIEESDRPALVDGFPRRLDQAIEFDAKAQEMGWPTAQVVFLAIDKSQSWSRLLKRGRDDDARAAWEERWREYEEKTLEAVEHYRGTGRLIEIDGSGDIKTVHKLIEKELNAPEDR